MTLGFEELVIGDRVEFKGPLGSFQWLGKGTAKWRGVERKAKNIGMICAGSGSSLPSCFLARSCFSLLFFSFFLKVSPRSSKWREGSSTTTRTTTPRSGS